MIISKKDRSHKNAFYMKIRKVWAHMMDRCYNEKDVRYNTYGAKGVTVSEEWHTLENFLTDVDSIIGWDKDKFMSSEIQLDKDLLVRGNKLYSKDTCKWATKEENRSYMPNLMDERVARSPEGEIIYFHYMREFSKQYGISEPSIIKCCKLKQKHTKNWQFRYVRDLEEHPFVEDLFEFYPKAVICTDSNGVETRHFSKYEALRYHGLDPDVHGSAARKVLKGELRQVKGLKMKYLH